eukprot:g707.t1
MSVRSEKDNPDQDASVTVESWLGSVGHRQYCEHFADAGYIDMETIAGMEKADFKEIGIKKPGHIKMLMRESKKSFSGQEEAVDMGMIALNAKYDIDLQGQNLSKREGTKVVLATTNDLQKTPLVAKITKSAMLEREVNVLQLLKSKYGEQANNFVVKLCDYIKDYPANGTSALIMERGVVNNGTLAERFQTVHDEQDVVEKVAVAYQLLQIGNFLGQAGLVWGDVKPGNFVSFNMDNKYFRYKAIDFDSCFSQRQAGLSAGELEALVTPGYIAPERAEILLLRKGQGGTEPNFPVLDSKQDVFIFGLILYRLFTGSEYFSSNEIESGEYEQKLADKSFQPVFPKSYKHKGVKTVLGEMLCRDPESRPSFEQVLRHSVWNSESSIRMSIIINKLSKMETSILKRVEDSFGRVEVQIEQLGKKVDSVFQLMINLQNSEYPYFCFCLPDLRKKEGGIFQWADNIKKGMLEKIGWKRYFRFYILDEGPMLLPGICKELDKPFPNEDGILVQVPGLLLKKIAPYMYFMSKICAMARDVGQCIPIAQYFLKTIDFGQLADSYKLIVSMTGQMQQVEGYMKKMETKMGILARHEKPMENASDKNSMLSVQTLEVMKAILGEKRFGKSDWKELVSSGKMKKVYKESDDGYYCDRSNCN